MRKMKMNRLKKKEFILVGGNLLREGQKLMLWEG